MAEGAAPLALARGDLAFTLIRSDRRTLGITVTADGDVIVRAPCRAATARVLAFVDARADWIAAARARLATRPPRTPPSTFVEEEMHRHLGTPYRLAVETGLRPAVRIEDDRLVLTMHRPNRIEARAALLSAWRRAEATRVYADRLTALLPPFVARGFARPPMTIRVLRRRWGSMGRSGEMTLSLDLIRAPLPAIDFVIAHELCHLVHFDHGPGFKALMSATMPDHRERRALLERALR